MDVTDQLSVDEYAEHNETLLARRSDQHARYLQAYHRRTELAGSYHDGCKRRSSASNEYSSD